MKSAWILALAFALLAPAAAQARKRCRPVEPPAATAETPESSLHWARGNDSSWVHAADPSWVHHEPESTQPEVAYDPAEGSSWVHETDYGWWAAGPDAGLNEIDEGDAPGSPLDEVEQDCTVSKDRNECVVLANQLATYQFRLGLATQREDELWTASLEDTIAGLEARGARRSCPWVEPSMQEKIKQTAEAVARAVGVAAQVAALFYRMGLF